MIIHPFTKSGLGDAPFIAVTPNANSKARNHVFFCEHCARMLKHRFFVKSADGTVSVVGSECVKKADEELYFELKEIQKKEIKKKKSDAQEVKISEKREREKAALSGLTKEEAINAALAQKEVIIETLESDIEALGIFSYLCKSNYGHFVIGSALNCKLPRKGAQTALIKKLTSFHAKGAKKKSELYTRAELLAHSELSEFISLVETASNKMDNLTIFISDLTNTHY